MVRNQGRVTRFVVMAVLQAARARTLGLPQEAAFSWGLNRAIFYAAAKHGFRGGTPSGDKPPDSATERPGREVYRLGDEEAFRDSGSEELIFTIGADKQTVADFEHQVEARFGTAKNFHSAWKEALQVTSSTPPAVLQSRRRFYEEVYRPRRDELSDRWTQEYSPAPKVPKKA
jgi:hypothetical protein